MEQRTAERRESLQPTLLKVLNQGRYDDAAEQSLRWDIAGGRSAKLCSPVGKLSSLSGSRLLLPLRLAHSREMLIPDARGRLGAVQCWNNKRLTAA